jgi:hypothetical protein
VSFFCEFCGKGLNSLANTTEFTELKPKSTDKIILFGHLLLTIHKAIFGQILLNFKPKTLHFGLKTLQSGPKTLQNGLFCNVFGLLCNESSPFCNVFSSLCNENGPICNVFEPNSDPFCFKSTDLTTVTKTLSGRGTDNCHRYQLDYEKGSSGFSSRSSCIVGAEQGR